MLVQNTVKLPFNKTARLSAGGPGREEIALKYIRCCMALFFFLAAPLSAVAASPEMPESIVVNKIAAVVNGEIITLHELRQHSSGEFVRMGLNPSDPTNRRQVEEVMSRVLTVMIDDMLLRQEAERLQIKVNDTEIDNELRKLVQRNQTTMQDFETRVAAQGGTMDMVRERLRNSILSQRIIGAMIARKAVVTSEEIHSYYTEHQNEFQAEKSVDVSLIVFSPTSNASEITNKIINGSLSFEEAARKYSEGPAPDNGGNLGMIRWDDLAPPIRAQVVNLSPGHVSDIFQINTRDCLIKLNDTQSGRHMTLEEATPEIERILREPRLQERFAEYTQQLRSRAVIDIRL